MTLPGEMIIVAVSGGPDSICLMDILSGLSGEMDIKLVLAHYEHGLRPGEDEYETRLVREYARFLDLPFETERASGLNSISSSIEERARNLRYDFLERTGEKYRANKIATGHNLNDQAETVLMRIMRGSGMTGLSGIPPVRDNTFIRPLIEISREDIIGYLRDKRLEYATDSSNEENRFLRNKIRLELLPEMKKYQPAIIGILGKLAENIRDENSYLQYHTEKWINENADHDESGDHCLDIDSIRDLPDAFIRRIIRHIIERHRNTLYGMDWDHVQDIINLIRNTRPNISLDLPGDLIVRKEYNRLILTSATPDIGTFGYEIEKGGELDIREISRRINIEELDVREQGTVMNVADTALLDKDLLPYPLTVRNFRPGDSFIPLGMKGHKKVKDFFIDLKTPPMTRKQTPILLKDDKIAWVGGYRIDDRFKVTARTKKILKITLS